MPNEMLYEDMSEYTIPGEVKVTIGYYDEGWCGDYDEDDPDDTPLLRFDAYDLREYDNAYDSRSWQDASFCTQIVGATPLPLLDSFCQALAEELEGRSEWKHLLEEWSWTSTAELQAQTERIGD